jgi:superfamily I DNA/RNA helicase
MNNTWWRSLEEMAPDQIKFIQLPPEGRYSLVGPAGSGKTNLLLLRAKYLAGMGEGNLLILTYTNALADFIRSGLNDGGLIRPEQVKTFHSWATRHVFETLGKKVFEGEGDFSEDRRLELLEKLIEANRSLPSSKLYSAIFVDEAQDLTVGELEALLCLSDKVCICGDQRQGIYNKDGLSVSKKLGLAEHSLKIHFRIGRRIAKIADRIIAPEKSEDSLEATSNYNEKVMGEDSAKMNPCQSRDEQFQLMIDKIRIQLDAFTGESIGIFYGPKKVLGELKEYFSKTDLANQVCYHKTDEDASFVSGKRIHVLTLHAAKGTEFRAVHIFGGEDLNAFPFNRTKLNYTAVTRAKTSLNVYRTGDTNLTLENAFAVRSSIGLDDLFKV